MTGVEGGENEEAVAVVEWRWQVVCVARAVVDVSEAGASVAA